MAQHRSYTFPMYNSEENTRVSPFTIRKDDISKLDSSQGFQIIRKLLQDDHQSAFCSNHLPSDKDIEESWLLHRDITHALIMPVLEIYRQASQLAESFLCPRNIFDLELAFRGEARGAFAWLQCLIMEEEDWCSTRGCPACIVSYVLQSEPTVRLILAACRLSRILRKPKAGRNLPLFDFWRSSLRRALDSDPFWGPSHSKDIESRAADLEGGIQQLIQQCCELSEAMPSTNGRETRSSDKTKSSSTQISTISHGISQNPTGLTASLFKKRSSSMSYGTQSWMQKILLGCWTTLLADAAEAGRLAAREKPLAATVAPVRARSLTS
ncbi:hypothetical protein MMC24_007152 [Lignoscripta atroalba]|nr:hypothetical protein [Lignoscripta atroalba]